MWTTIPTCGEPAASRRAVAPAVAVTGGRRWIRRRGPSRGSPEPSASRPSRRK
ncbi:hypothetical protein ACFSM7_09610 [Clavibacter michiganensis subsp. tessellarius]|uniref:hypothetical protein n=1 Tax=Clavibacter tessellarius TaxID=31965 RepID=UPI003642E5CD